MTQAQLSISRLISVSVVLSPKAAANQNLSTLLILGTSAVINPTERLRSYSGLDGVAADFGTSAPEYFAAALWFEQAPQPSTLFIGFWAQTASHGHLIGATLSAAQQALANFTGIANGGFDVSVDGIVQHLTALNLTAVTNLNGVASAINGELSGATVAWNSVYGRFEFTSSTTGASSAISFLTAPASGTDLSILLGGRATSSGAYVAPGIVAESAATAVAIFDAQFGQQWYAVQVLGLIPGANGGADSAALLAVSAFIEGTTTKHLHGITTQEAGVLVAATTTDIAYEAKQLAYKRTVTQYSSSSAYAIASALGRLLTVDFNGNSTAITLAYKQEPGVVPENLNTTQVNSAVAKRALVIVAYNNNTAIIEPDSSVMASGDYCDDITDTDWLATAIQTALFNALYTTGTKIPQTDAGNHVLVATAESICSQGVTNGVLGPGVWDVPGFGSLKQGDFLERSFYVYAPPVATQNPSNRAARESVPLQIAAKLAGAIHKVSVIINVDR